MKILLADNDPVRCARLETVLVTQQYLVEIAEDAQTALALAQQFDYDLMVLDINIAGGAGIQICQQLRTEGRQLPIVLLSQISTSQEQVAALDAGADDYLAMPMPKPELLARIRALVRRGSETAGATVTWGALQFNQMTQEIHYGERLLRLTPKEYGILELLLLNPHRIFSRAALIDRLWSLEETPTENAISSHIKGIRHKLKAAGATQDLIETMYGFGYRLRALENDSAEPANASVTQNNEPDSEAIASVMQDLWEQFKDSFTDQMAVLEQVVQASLAGTLTPELRQEARLTVHKLVGSLGVYGFTQGSVLAGQIESLLHPDIQLDTVEQQQLREWVAALQQELNQPPAFNSSPSSPSSPSPSSSLVPLSSPQARVLAVDDDPAISQQVVEVMTPWGLDIKTLNDPQQFWQILTTTCPDLLILDIEMPGYSGIDLCQKIRDDQTWGNLPILFLTAHHEAEFIAQAFAAGGDDYIRKPILEAELIARVLNRLEPAQLRQKRYQQKFISKYIS